MNIKFWSHPVLYRMAVTPDGYNLFVERKIGWGGWHKFSDYFSDHERARDFLKRTETLPLMLKISNLEGELDIARRRLKEIS